MQESVDVAPIAWWQHAGNAVTKEAQRLTGADGIVSTRFWQRRELRERYQMIYLEHRASTFWQRSDLIVHYPALSQI